MMPEVSVVMAVRNDTAGLNLAARSVLEQRDVALELIVVDDGSEDATPARLSELAGSDGRVRPFLEPHRGLTRSLVLACGAAAGRVLARQDAADYSFPWRLRSQLDLLERQPSTVLVSCWTECVGPKDEPLQVVRGGRSSDEAVRLSLPAGRHTDLTGPSWHGSTMFRRDAYSRVGGYRTSFSMAQDWDLWWRLSEQGEFSLVPRVLYRARLVPGSISLTHPRLQRQFGKLGREAHEARLEGRKDGEVLARAAALSRRCESLRTNRFGRARGLYFIGSLLRKVGDARGRSYFRDSLRANPLHLKAWIRWLLR